MEITLTKWTRPNSYVGPSYPEYYYADGLGRNRDSDCLTESNHAVCLRTLQAIEPERAYERDRDGTITYPEGHGWQLIRDSHWAVGWIEYILIHESRRDLLEAIQTLVDRKADYPVLDEDDFSEKEQQAADETWRNCYDVKERIKYIRDHRSQFDFYDWASVRAVVKGEYFSGYASELIY